MSSIQPRLRLFREIEATFAETNDQYQSKEKQTVNSFSLAAPEA